MSDKRDHYYLSTACHHEQHDECRESCKFCSERCNCSCHKRRLLDELRQGRP